MKRRHQVEFERTIAAIIAGSPVRNILVSVCPGGGKSSLPIIAGRLITAGLADRICWICPRMTLQDQAERNFIDPFFREMFGHELSIRSSTNENDPCRGLNGFVTTYQAIGVDQNETVLRELRRRRYVLVLDEYHHAAAEEEAAWTEAIFPLYQAAAYRILMTGTLERGDGKRIAFTRYDPFNNPILNPSHETAVIQYGRRDALADRAIIPLSFMFTDGRAKWETDSGETKEAQLSQAYGQDKTHALYTALHTEYAHELLHAAVQHWQKSDKGKLLIVAANIKTAKEYTAYLKTWNHNVRIATSDDGKQAAKAIKAFKTEKLDVLVSVNIAYEGLDVPAISHIACLTNIRSTPWIEQMVARAVRVDPRYPYDAQRAFIFAPDDQAFREIAAQIEADQITPAHEQGKKENGGNGDGGNGELFDEKTPGNIKPLASWMTNRREVLLSGSQTSALKTPKESETWLREQIEQHIRTFSFNNRFNPKRINAEIYAFFEKPRADMTLKELESVMSWIQQQYPVNHIRGTGRARVPTKAREIAVEWR